MPRTRVVRGTMGAEGLIGANGAPDDQASTRAPQALRALSRAAPGGRPGEWRLLRRASCRWLVQLWSPFAPSCEPRRDPQGCQGYARFGRTPARMTSV